ncbi:hypothetical protein [Marinobacterium lutimaris]|uniref:Uncharacterized protein n=1 Tax=Marinobacterium lutimaris TaxID=568106 RepID=A0A1H5YBA3_9GAMM|nr:hypothetical protein [Marinobacterium lutimaris]SEG21042.1 hypothetical protein SAMN05444390_1011682 [Marinobacterium lutimaris]
MLTIGIDPDQEKCGVGIANGAKLVDMKALHLFELMTLIDQYVEAGAKFVVEDVELAKPTFPKNFGKKPLTPVQKQKIREKISQDVGRVKCLGRLVVAYLKQAGADYVAIKPLGGYAKQTKKDAALFNRITGWTGRSNEDQRDAAMLALFGTRERRLNDVASR